MFQRRTQWTASRATASISVAALLLLQACGSTEEEDGNAAATPPTAAETTYDVELTGSVGDGPIVNADLRVIANDGTILSNAISDQLAGYNIQLRTKGKYYPLTIDARGGTDLTTGMAPGFTLMTSATAPRKKLVANINPFTTLAMAIARQMNGGLSTANISSALSTVMSQFNTGLTSSLSLDPMTTPIDPTNLAEIVKASEALAEIFRRVQSGLAQPGVSVDAVIDAIAADVVDGKLDGLGNAGADRRIAALTVVAASQVMLEAMVNRLEVGGQDVTPTLDGIIRQLATGGNPALTGTRPVTAQMIAQARRGVAAAIALNDSAALQTLSAALGTIVAGMSSAAAAQALPAMPSIALDSTLYTLATASSLQLDTVIAGQSPAPPVQPAPPPPTANTAPTISGTPPTSVMQDTAYAFTPTATDADGNPLTFMVTGLPSWASFSPSTGALTGTPTGAQVGTYSGITISVTDGIDTVQFAPFSIAVQATALGSATLTWVAPTQNTDGSPLTNLAGYRVRWGQQSGNYTASVTIMNAGVTNYVVDQLTPGTYYFSVSALNDVSAESSFSNEASKTIN